MDAGVHITSAARGGAYAEEQESRHAHAQQDGEEELGSPGGVHGFAASRERLWKTFSGKAQSADGVNFQQRLQLKRTGGLS